MRAWDGTKRWNCWESLRRRFGPDDEVKASVILSERSESKDPYSVQTWGLYCEHLVALHGFIKKTRATPDEGLAIARKRQKELER